MSNETTKAWRKANADRVKEYGKTYSLKWRAQNQESIKSKHLIHQPKWRADNLDSVKKIEAKSRRKHKAKRNNYSTAMRDSLSDSYIASRLGIPVATLRQHPELLEAKREQLQILRTLKPRKTRTNAQES